MIRIFVGGVLALIFIISCQHKETLEPVFVCESPSGLAFADIEPIIMNKCSVSGCHNGDSPTIPILKTHQELLNNQSDCIFQISHGAMPPANALQLSEFETGKILCWLKDGAH